MNYKEPFFLEGRRGNNAFAYEARGTRPRLYVPSVREGSVEDVKVGEQVTFEDVDENGVLRSCKGLEHFVKLEWEGVPAVVVDNHNHALFFWYEALAKGLLKPGAVLVHVDQHKDMRRPERLLSSADLKEVFATTNEEVNVGNYIVPALEQGLVGELLLVTGEEDLKSREFLAAPNKILNIDLDFFAPELGYIDFEEANAFLHAHLKTAAFVTIATSPFFIDQEQAIRVLRKCLLPYSPE